MMFTFNWRGYVDSRPLVLLDLLQADLCDADVAHGSLHILQGMQLHTHFMFLKWIHPHQCTRLAGLRDCAHWTAHQNHLNSLCTTTQSDKRAGRSLTTLNGVSTSVMLFTHDLLRGSSLCCTCGFASLQHLNKSTSMGTERFKFSWGMFVWVVTALYSRLHTNSKRAFFLWRKNKVCVVTQNTCSECMMFKYWGDSQ